MSALLRADGADFDVDAFLSGCTLPVSEVLRKGDLVRPSEPEGRRYSGSYVFVTASVTEFVDLPKQVAEAMEFLDRERDQVRRLLEFPGVERAKLDFGVGSRDVCVQCDVLPPELLQVAASLGLGVGMSIYWGDDEAAEGDSNR